MGDLNLQNQTKIDQMWNKLRHLRIVDNSYYETDYVIRGATSLYRRYYHIPLTASNPGASGATWVAPSANSTGGWNVTAATHFLDGKTDIHADWDGASDFHFELKFAVNTNNTGGADTDTVDIKIQFFYKGTGETACKSQTVEVATVVGKSAQYKMFEADFVMDWDASSNVVEVGDVIGFRVNLETDTSEVDNIIITDMSFSYHTTHTYVEDGDA